MVSSFIWNSENSHENGLWVKQMPKTTKPRERYQTINIPGRAGVLTLKEGDDIYDSTLKEIVVQTTRDNVKTPHIINWLRGSGKLILSTDKGKAYDAEILDEVAFSNISNDLMQATIPFICSPFKRRRYPDGDNVRIITDGGIFNPGDVRSFPKSTINATDAGQVLRFAVNGAEFKVDMTGMEDTGCVVFSETEMVLNYAENVLFTEKSTGDFPVFLPGNNQITLIAGISSIDIEPGWRWLG